MRVRYWLVFMQRHAESSIWRATLPPPGAISAQMDRPGASADVPEQGSPLVAVPEFP